MTFEDDFRRLLKEYKDGGMTEGVVIDWLQKHRNFAGFKRLFKIEKKV